MRETIRRDGGQAHDAVRTGAATPRQPAPLEALQRAAGNRAVCDLLAVGQAKLEVGAADDPYEREADAVARRVVEAMRTGASKGSDTVTETISRVQRRALPEVGAAGGSVGAETEQAIHQARQGNGQPLEPTARRSFEGAFGTDLSGVRLHRGPAAEHLNERVGARAFTVGRDVFLGAGTPSLTSNAGRELLAHELTHTVQQSGGRVQASRLQRLWPWTTTPTATTPPSQGTTPADDPEVKREKAAEKLDKALKAVQRREQELQRLQAARKKDKQAIARAQQSLAQLRINQEKARQELNALPIEAHQAKQLSDFWGWGNYFGTWRSGGGTKGDTSGMSPSDTVRSVPGGERLVGEKDPKQESRFGSSDQEYTRNQKDGRWEKSVPATEPDKSAYERATAAALDISLIEINLNPEELNLLPGLNLASQFGGALTAGGMKGAGKIELVAGAGGKLLGGEMGRAWVAGDLLNSETKLEGFIGAKGALASDVALTWEELSVKGEASAFAGVELAAKTEVVLKIAGKEAGRFKGGIGAVFGIGGAVAGSIKWPWASDGTLEIKCNLKASLGFGFSYEIDWKIPTKTWAQWGWEWASSWFTTKAPATTP